MLKFRLIKRRRAAVVFLIPEPKRVEAIFHTRGSPSKLPVFRSSSRLTLLRVSGKLSTLDRHEQRIYVFPHLRVCFKKYPYAFLFFSFLFCTFLIILYFTLQKYSLTQIRNRFVSYPTA